MEQTKKDAVNSVLLAINSTLNLEKYPRGNAELAARLIQFERENKITFDPFLGKWTRKTNNK